MGIINKFKILFFLLPVIIYSQEINENLTNFSVVDTLIHKVQKKQTLYLISKIYNITIEDIRKYNPQIKGSRLSRKMLLNIPVKREFLEKTTPLLVKNDTIIYDSLKTDYFKVNLIDSTINKKFIKIAILAPFKLDQIELDSVENSKFLLKNLNLTTVSLDFYSGAINAINMVKKSGINLEVDVIDTKNNFITISEIIDNKTIEDYDFILGPLIPRNINQLSRAIVKSKIPIISPLSSKEIEINENVVQSMPSKLNQRNRMLEYIDLMIEDEPDPCVMIIYDNNHENIKQQLYERFPYAELINTDENDGYVDPKVTDSLLVSTKNNIVFLESENLNIITSVSSLLNSQISSKRNISMLTTFRSDVYENENISFEHLGNLNFTYPSYYMPIYNNEKIDLFNNSYLEEFGKRPNKIAIRGHDIILDLILRVANKKKFNKSIKIGETEYLQNKFNYFPLNKGFINKSIYLIKHEKLNILEIK
jgi:hypothetical protein|tara:strand:+ start:6471 stop:7907 length:1437 start_codon:yes stop_codon:yes gene_type:complete